MTNADGVAVWTLRRADSGSALGRRRSALAVLLLVDRLLARRLVTNFQFALTEDDLHLRVGNGELHFEGLGLDDRVVLDRSRQLDLVDVEFTSDGSLTLELAR